jgi:uncharacterized membrane protein
MITEPLAILAVLLGAIIFAVWITKRYAWAARFSVVLWIIFGSALCSNLGLIPDDAPLYGATVGFAVPFAVCVILFTVRLSDIRDAGMPMLVAFVLAAIGTVLGVVVASLALDPLLAKVLADDSWKIAGPYTGTYIGGSLNFFALWTGLEIGRPDLLAAANAVDNLTLFPLYATWMIVPALLAGKYVVAARWQPHHSAGAEAAPETAKPPLEPAQVATLVFLAVAVMAVSSWLKAAFIDAVAPAVPTILVITTLALVLGQFPAVRRLGGAWEIGDLAFWLFFAAVGAMIDIYQAVVLSPVLFLYVLVIMTVHFTWVYGIGRLLRMDLGVLTIASVATKAGPPLILPVAEAKGWRHLVLPGVILGMLGYAIGNYVGFAVANGVRALLG